MHEDLRHHQHTRILIAIQVAVFLLLQTPGWAICQLCNRDLPADTGALSGNQQFPPPFDPDSLARLQRSDPLAESLRYGRPSEQIETIAAIGRRGRDPNYEVEILRTALIAQDPLVRARGAVALGRVGDDWPQEGSRALRDLVETARTDRNSRVRVDALNAIQRIGYRVPWNAEYTLPVILQIGICDPDPEVSYAAIKVLGAVHVTGVIAPTLIHALRSESDRERTTRLLDASSLIGTDLSAQALEQVLRIANQDNDPDLQIRALHTIKESVVPSRADRDLVAWSVFKILLHGRDSDVRAASREAFDRAMGPSPFPSQMYVDSLTAQVLRSSDEQLQVDLLDLATFDHPISAGSAAHDSLKALRKRSNSASVNRELDLVLSLSDMAQADSEFAARYPESDIASSFLPGQTKLDATRALNLTMQLLQRADSLRLGNRSPAHEITLAYDPESTTSPHEPAPHIIRSLSYLLQYPSLQEPATYALNNLAVRIAANADRVPVATLDSVIEALKDARYRMSELEEDRGNRIPQDVLPTLTLSLRVLERNIKNRLIDNAIDWIRNEPYASIAILYLMAVSFTCAVLFFFFPLMILRLNDRLRPFSDLRLPPWLGGFQLSLRVVLGIGIFEYHPKVMDAWVRAQLATARDTFDRRPTAVERAQHLTLPVTLNGRVIATPAPADFRQVFAKDRSCLVISGEGGAGKTSLACQLAKWAMSESAAEWIAPHPAIAILVEYEFDFTVESTEAFLVDIRGQLQATLRLASPLPPTFVEHLLRTRRVIVIVDHFSELNPAVRSAIRPLHPEFTINALVITSRSDSDLAEVERDEVRPLRVHGNRLSSFVEAYLQVREKRSLFDDPEFFEACRHLSVLVGTREVTPLLARLFADLLIASKEAPDDSDVQLPQSIPDMILQYLNELNRSATDTDPGDREVHRAAKAVAWECVKRTFTPTTAKREDVIQALGANAEGILHYLEDRLHLIRTVGAARLLVRFTLDPIADYLAAMYLVEARTSESGAFDAALSTLSSIDGAAEHAEGFRRAFEEAYRHASASSSWADADLPSEVASPNP